MSPDLPNMINKPCILAGVKFLLRLCPLNTTVFAHPKDGSGAVKTWQVVMRSKDKAAWEECQCHADTVLPPELTVDLAQDSKVQALQKPRVCVCKTSTRYVFRMALKRSSH
ncbi:hypothetical protein ACMAY8_04880 [Rhodobacteraceae bacterium nBUS_22]